MTPKKEKPKENITLKKKQRRKEGKAVGEHFFLHQEARSI